MPRGDCQWCAGAGQVPEEACRVCRGAGVEQLSRTVRVAVPRSARDGQVLRVTGKGRWGVQGRGDLRLTLKVEPQPHLRRLGDDLEADVTVGVLQAVLGGVAYVPSAEDRQYKIQVNPGSSSGKRYRIKGHGMYKGREGDARGDLFAVINIQVPDEKSLSEKERQLYRLLLEAETSRQAEMLEAEAQVD
jgi:molecular chaperone DnaJ